MLALGVCLVILALTALSYAVLTPPVARVPASRRTAPGTPILSPVQRFVGGLEHVVDMVLRHRNWNPFPAQDLDTIVTHALAWERKLAAKLESAAA